jgi:hypothetical protein
MKILKIILQGLKHFAIFLLLLATSHPRTGGFRPAFEYLRSPEYYKTKESAYRERYRRKK